LDYPNFPFPELQHVVVPHVYAHDSFLVYVLDIPLLSSTMFYLYKILPYPIRKQDVFSFVNPVKENIFVDALKKQFGKMSTNELLGCFRPNELQKVCKANIPIFTYIPNSDCEMVLIHPSSTTVPESCEITIMKLTKTYWIPLQMSNQWLYVAPEPEKLSVLCNTSVKQIDIKERGRLTLQSGCKAYTSYVTLYAMSTISKNISNDFLPTIPMNFDCCLTFEETKDFSQLPLSILLSNIMSSVDDLRVASHKVDEVEKIIKEQDEKNYSHYYKHITSWSGVIMIIISVIVSCCCCFCCCKSCRNLWFRLWDRRSPKACWKETTDRLCINITNIQGKQPTVRYEATKASPVLSIRSLPNALVTSSNEEYDEDEPISLPVRISLRNKRFFR
jgi:hypothetical protein